MGEGPKAAAMIPTLLKIRADYPGVAFRLGAGVGTELPDLVVNGATADTVGAIATALKGAGVRFPDGLVVAGKNDLGALTGTWQDVTGQDWRVIVWVWRPDGPSWTFEVATPDTLDVLGETPTSMRGDQ